jgi:hypothetical protein
MHLHNLDHLGKALSVGIKVLKRGYKRYNLDRRNLATML